MFKMKKIILFLIFTIFSAGPALAQAPTPRVEAKYTTSTTIVGTGENPGNPTSTKCETNPTDCLREEFNIVVDGPSSREKLNDVYKLLSEVGVATKYKVLMKTSGPTILEFQDTSEGGCPGVVKRNITTGKSMLTLRNYSLTGCSQTTRKSRLTHETGHIIRNGHMRLFEVFESQAYFPKDSPCYEIDTRFTPSYFIKTYNKAYRDYAAGIGVSISGSNETFAEFTALYVIPQGGYPRRCPIGYNWTKENIYTNYPF